MTKLKAVSTSVECKKFVLNSIRLIQNSERYFFAKFMELFKELNSKHQTGLIQYLADRYDQKKWKERVDDSTMYNEVIRSVLFYFSGRDELSQPSKKEMAHALREYLDSGHFKDAEENESSADFSSAILEI